MTPNQKFSLIGLLLLPLFGLVLTFEPCSAAEQFKLHFRLTAVQSDNVYFPSGFTSKSPWAGVQNSSLHLSVAADARVLSETTVRFWFVNPLSIDVVSVGRIEAENVRSKAEYRYIDLSFSADDMKRLARLQNMRTDDFFLQEGKDPAEPFNTIEKVLKYADTGAPLEPLVDLNNVGSKVQIPELYTFGGDIQIGDIPFSEFNKNQTSAARLGSCDMMRVSAFDSFRLIIRPDEHVVGFSVDRVLNAPLVSAFDHTVKRFLKVQQKIKEIGRRKWGLLVAAAAHEPFDLEENVEHHDFSKRCESTIKGEPRPQAEIIRFDQFRKPK